MDTSVLGRQRGQGVKGFGLVPPAAAEVNTTVLATGALLNDTVTTDEYTFAASSADSVVSATLVWIDLPATGNAWPTLINDLDLASGAYYGNHMFNGATRSSAWC